MNRVFVYGTLKRNFSAHQLMKNAGAQFECEARTSSDYRLYKTKGWFPGLLKKPKVKGEPVTGEVFLIPEENMGPLDRYEGISNGLFRRETIDLEDGTQALAYVFGDPTYVECLMPEGVWE